MQTEITLIKGELLLCDDNLLDYLVIQENSMLKTKMNISIL